VSVRTTFVILVALISFHVFCLVFVPFNRTVPICSGGAHGSISDLQGEEKGRERAEEAMGDRILPPPNRANPIFFGEIRFPASRSILW
jgi:hypothetical protein